MSLFEKYPIKLSNSLTREKEDFKPINAPFVGMYVCGPTVYGDPHLGHARPYVTFDIVKRYFGHLGLKVRYVRNITDVGHLVNDGDEGEDKIAKKAKLEQLEPMEIVQEYTLSFHKAMNDLNNLPPDIEPTASGHIMEQIEIVEQIMENGFAYESNGSIYFDVKKYNESHHYGTLSGRNIEDMIDGAGTRDLDGVSDKRNGVDFALWKKAEPEHIMRWKSPWGIGFPGWHIECTAMSTKYLGKTFDIHGGGMDLKFPHHEAEIAQSKACCGVNPANYWMHNNMITINGQKMGKSLGNFINLNQFFNGTHELLDQAYSPMTVRFFMMQSHYGSPVDFSNVGLKAAEKGYKKLMNSLAVLNQLTYNEGQIDEALDTQINKLIDELYLFMSDDFNTPKTLSNLFDLSSKINSFHDKKLDISKISKETFKSLQIEFNGFILDVLGLSLEKQNDNDQLNTALDLLIELRNNAKSDKNYQLADEIRDQLAKEGIQLKDGKDGTTYSLS
jgi:cysteinyl-tRNA synthetase